MSVRWLPSSISEALWFSGVVAGFSGGVAETRFLGLSLASVDVFVFLMMYVSQSKGSLVPLPQVQVGEKELDALLEEKPFFFSFDDTNCRKENKNKNNKSKTCIAEGCRYWFQISSWVTYLLRVFE